MYRYQCASQSSLHSDDFPSFGSLKKSWDTKYYTQDPSRSPWVQNVPEQAVQGTNKRWKKYYNKWNNYLQDIASMSTCSPWWGCKGSPNLNVTTRGPGSLFLQSVDKTFGWMSSEAGTTPHPLAVAVQPRALVACHTECKQRFEIWSKTQIFIPFIQAKGKSMGPWSVTNEPWVNFSRKSL